jgi:hypothetical protein
MICSTGVSTLERLLYKVYCIEFYSPSSFSHLFKLHLKSIIPPYYTGPAAGLSVNSFAKQDFCSLHPQAVGTLDCIMQKLAPPFEQSTILLATVLLTHSFVTARNLFPIASTPPLPQHRGVSRIVQSEGVLQLYREA